MSRYKFLTLRVTLMASLFVSNFSGLLGQTFIDVFGRSEYTMPSLTYDSINDELSCRIISSNLGMYPINDTSSTIHSVRFSSSFSVLNTSSLLTKGLSGLRYNYISSIPSWNGYVLAERFDYYQRNNRGEWPFLSNCDLCEFRNDSLLNCTALFTDSSYSSVLYGWHATADSLIVLAGHYEGINDTVENKVLIGLNKSTRKISTQPSSIVQNGIEYLPSSSPILLPNGEWFVRLAEVNVAEYHSVVSSDWSTARKVGIGGFSHFTKAWLIKDKIVYVTAEMKDWVNWNPSDPVQPQITFTEYDYINDTIVAKHYFDFSNDTSELSSHTFGYAAMYDGENFVLCGRRSTEFLQQEPALFVGIIDTNFNLVNRLIIEDTVSNAYPLILGNIHGLAKGKTGDYFYFGSMNDLDVNPNGNGSDIMLGKISTSNIGLKEPIPLRKQELWMYPNPSNGAFTLTSTTIPFKPYSYQVLDNSGKICASGKINTEKERVSLNLSAGSYYLLSDSGEVLAFVVER